MFWLSFTRLLDPRALSRTSQCQECVAERAPHFTVDGKQGEEKGKGASGTQDGCPADQHSAPRPHILKFPECSKMAAQGEAKHVQHRSLCSSPKPQEAKSQL